MREQVGDPHRIVHVSLPAGHVLDVHRVGQHELERAIENMPDRLPVDAGGLQPNVRAAALAEPIRQL
jgi:hypothetical protein